MNGKDFNEVVSLILKEDKRYDRGAYLFVREALDYTVKEMGQPSEKPGRTRHVSGRDLCEGARDYALEQYGPMASTLLKTWGVSETMDLGEIVYNLVELEVFGTQEGDRKEDFIDIFDFEEAFEKPFLPAHRGGIAEPLKKEQPNSND
jgi:uncharacterized repeat protein (TIGR04138 family)